jgi:hypothetical protein
MNKQNIERSVVFGLAAGMRTSAPLVACALKKKPWQWYLLLGEFVADKLPYTPSRLMPGAWFGRMATAGYGAYEDAKHRKEAPLVSGIAAVAVAFLATKIAHDLRMSLVKLTGIPDPYLALLEDAATLACVVSLRDSGGLPDGNEPA